MIEKGWAIAGVYGLYTGWWLTRKEAIKAHCRGRCMTWQQCRRKKDRAVKIEISYL
jgi:hypothetical protein